MTTESSELRHRMLQPPPQHPSNFRSCLSTSVPNATLSRTPSPKPPLPPRPPSYLQASDDQNMIGALPQEGSRPQDLPYPTPSHPRELAETTSERQRAPLMRSEISRPDASSFVHPPLHSPELSHADSTRVNISMQQDTLENRDRSSSFESSYSYEKLLSEKELRDLYDDEEIDWFLRLFSTHVTEVTLQCNPETNTELPAGLEAAMLEEHDAPEDNDEASITESPTFSVKSVNKDLCLSEQIAFGYILPLLPSMPPARPPFSIGRLRLTVQRLYLALEPSYRLVLLKLIYLATWQDKILSFKLCAGFWVLWLFNLLLPSTLLYLLYSLFRRKMYPYPSLAELRQYRDQVDRAKEVGEGLQAQMAVSAFGVKDAWRIFRSFKNRSQNTAGNPSKEGEIQDLLQEGSLLDDPNETDAERDMKAMALEVMVEFADGLERLKNIFLWRQPASSNAFALFLAISFIMTLTIPTQYLAKLFFFVTGVTFWHIPPIVAAIPPHDRRRFLTFCHQIPTDADYAMEVIARRVASGQAIKPPERRRHSASERPQGDSFDSPATVNQDNNQNKGFEKSVGIVKALASESVKMVSGQPFIQKAFTPNEAKGGNGKIHTYPCQYGTSPGVITLTSTTLFFTTLMSSHAKVTIPLAQISGIKKGGSRSISVQFKDSEGSKSERFLWVYERGDLFGRLVGSGGRKWLKI